MADLVGKPYATLMSELSQQPGHKLGAELLLPLMDVCESAICRWSSWPGSAAVPFVPCASRMTGRCSLSRA